MSGEPRSTSVFPVRLRASSSVGRWSTVHRLKPEFMDGHSWQVVGYSILIADIIKWNGDLFGLTVLAQWHDLDEIITGDVVSPVKHGANLSDNLKVFGNEQAEIMFPNVMRIYNKCLAEDVFSEARRIVKCADLADSLFSACSEYVMGNTAIRGRILDSLTVFKKSWFNLPCDTATLTRLWDNEIKESYLNHTKGDNYDISISSRHS